MNGLALLSASCLLAVGCLDQATPEQSADPTVDTVARTACSHDLEIDPGLYWTDLDAGWTTNTCLYHDIPGFYSTSFVTDVSTAHFPQFEGTFSNYSAFWTAYQNCLSSSVTMTASFAASESGPFDAPFAGFESGGAPAYTLDFQHSRFTVNSCYAKTGQGTCHPFARDGGLLRMTITGAPANGVAGTQLFDQADVNDPNIYPGC